MKTFSSLGRFIYAVPFALFGIFHFMNAKAMAGLISGFPVAEGFVYITGLALILASISIIINVKARLATLLLALFLLIIILTVQVPGIMSGDAQMSQNAMSSLLKDVALLGAAVTYSGILKK